MPSEAPEGGAAMTPVELDAWRVAASRLLCLRHVAENVPDATEDEVEAVVMFQRCDLCDALVVARWTPSRQRAQDRQEEPP